MFEDDMQSLLVALVEQARAMAARISGDPDREAPCHFCGAPLTMWENLLVMQLTGVAAHVRCPKDALEQKLKESGPDRAFPYQEFSAAVEKRLGNAFPTACSGIIDLG
jgi:hypothetical protein